MVDSGFVEFKLGEETIAAGQYLCKKIKTSGGHVFSVRCYPRGSSEKDGGKYVSLMLFLVSKSKSVKPIFDAFVVDKDGAPSSSHTTRTTSVDTVAISDTRGAFLPRFMKRSDLDSLYVAGNCVVTLVCGVIVRHENPMPIAMPTSDIGTHLGRMLDCTDGSDVSFYVGGQMFHAHRAVLAARSPVFKAALLVSMVEPTAPCITIQNMDPIVFKALLRFVYTDALPATEGEVDGYPVDFFRHLLAAADHYALDGLKLVCAHKLWETMSVDTVALVLACAEMHNCRELKETCMDFLVAEENFNKAMLTDGFGQLARKFPSITTELRKRVGCSMYS